MKFENIEQTLAWVGFLARYEVAQLEGIDNTDNPDDLVAISKAVEGWVEINDHCKSLQSLLVERRGAIERRLVEDGLG